MNFLAAFECYLYATGFMYENFRYVAYFIASHKFNVASVFLFYANIIYYVRFL